MCFPPWLGDPWFGGKGPAGFCEWILAVKGSMNRAGAAVFVVRFPSPPRDVLMWQRNSSSLSRIGRSE